MKEAREAQGVTLEALSELTGYPVDFLRRMEDEGQTAPRVVTSRISAVLGVEHTAVRGEGPQEVTRLKDIVERT
jgi:ribosome-binding protein aMBF1 (putative translation factor)